MRFMMALGVVALGAGCAHSPKGPDAAGPEPVSRARQLSDDAQRAYTALDFGRCEAGFRASAEADSDEGERAESFYRAAGCAALAGHADAAVVVLKRALDSGYFDADHLEYNPELQPLHGLAPWREVVAQARANLSKAPEPPFPVPRLDGVDAFGSKQVDSERVRRVLGLEVGKPVVHSGAIFRQKEKALREQYGLAYVKVSMTMFFAEERKGTAFLVVDMVDAADAARLRFLPVPEGHPEDPAGLVARWRDYEDHLFPLQMQGKLEESSSCKVAHCTGGFGHPDLVAYEPEFIAKVPQHLDGLTAVLREDADAEKRGAAAFLLAYAPTPEETVRRLVPFIRDPDDGARNNVLRVLVATQEAATKPLVDVATVVDAISMPTTLDRNKSVYLLTYLLEDLPPAELKAQKAALIQKLGETLVAMASLIQPINRDPAVKVLKQLSGESYETGEEWRAWLARQPRTAG
jgi:hypothetical protein